MRTGTRQGDAPAGAEHEARPKARGRFRGLGVLVTLTVVVWLVVLLVARVQAAQLALQRSAPSGGGHGAASSGGVGAVTGPGTGALSGPGIGAPAPDFTITTWTPNGGASQTVRLAALRGRPVVLNFWASWCYACKEEEPALVRAYRQYAHQGVEFIGVAVNDQRPDGEAFLRTYGVTFPSGPDDANGSITVAYALPGIPVTVFIGRDGVVMNRYTGAIKPADLDRAIQQLLKQT